MKKEKPIKTIANSGKHKTEKRIFARNIQETYCVHPGCKFRGKNAQQGVCHTTTTFTGSKDWSYIDAAFKESEAHLKQIREIKVRNKMTDKQYIKDLESQIVCGFSNEIFRLDELIFLRKKVALLSLKSIKNK